MARELLVLLLKFTGGEIRVSLGDFSSWKRLIDLNT